MLDDDRTVISSPIEAGKDPAPVNVPQPRHARHLPAYASGKDSALVQTIMINHQVLGMDMQHVAAEFADETLLVDHLPDEMRGVEVHADVTAPGFQDAAPDIRRVGDVVSAWPFVI